MSLTHFNIFDKDLNSLSKKKMLINTINAYSYNVTKKDSLFKEALMNCDVLIPDGVSIVWAIKLLEKRKIKKIAGADLFLYQMEKLEKVGGKCFFLGSTNTTLKKIRDRAKIDYPNVIVETFSPPYKSEFTSEENEDIIKRLNKYQADAVFVGMTAPKQEKWAYDNFSNIETGHICSIGAVFDFYAGNVKRAPDWAIRIGLEWLYRFVKEPKRLWKRYMYGNGMFVYYILKEKIGVNSFFKKNKSNVRM